MQQHSDNGEDSSRSVEYSHFNTLLDTNNGKFGDVRNVFKSLDNREGYNQGHTLPPIGVMPIQDQYVPLMNNTYGARQSATAALDAMSPMQFPKVDQNWRDSFGEDTQMTTPVPSRTTSQVQEQELKRINLGENASCGCSNHQSTNHDHSTPSAQIGKELSQAGRPNVMALPSLLNDSLAQSRADMISGRNRSWVLGSQPIINKRVSISTTTSYSMMSTCSSTICAPVDIVESRYYLISTLYQTCLDASTSYIRKLPSKSHHRHRWYLRYEPYSTATTSSFRNNYDRILVGKSPPTLMDNISTISTRLWKKARKNLMAPHYEEMTTVAKMSDLYAWSELIVKATESEGVQNSASDIENNAVLGVLEDGEYYMVKVCKAARSLCEWLVDQEAIGICAGVMAELNDLFQKDQDAAFADIGAELEQGSIT